MKAYEQGTTTPLSMATDATGATTLVKAELDIQGFPITAGSVRFIPFINGDYDLWLFPTEAEADANDTTSAIQLADNLNADASSGLVISSYTVANKAAAVLLAPVTGKSLVVEGSDGGLFKAAVGAAPGTYSDDSTTYCGTVFIPTGGDGSIAWVRNDVYSINVRWFGASSTATAAVNLAAFEKAVIAAGAQSVPVDLIGGTYDLSALWHVNLPVSVMGRGATLTGGDADGVMWYGYRTGASQDSYFENTFVENIDFAGTNSAGAGFTSSKSISVLFANLKSLSGAGNGLVFEAAVGCTFIAVQGRLNGFSGIIFTYFTNSDGTTYVPSTANTIDGMIADENGTDATATALTSYGVLCDKDPDGFRAAYNNTFNGGFVQLNEFSGVRDFGDNVWDNVWNESNGKDVGTVQQYNFWDSGPLGSIILNGRIQGAGVLRKLYVDGAVSKPITRNVHFEGTLQTDIEYETTIAGTHTGANNASVLTDSSKAWGTNALAGLTITNTTDGSTATITANTEQTVTGTLSGGTDNDWDTSDAYTIANAGTTDFIQEDNYYSGSSPEITPSNYDIRNNLIGTVRRTTPLGTMEWGGTDLALLANSTGSPIFHTLFTLDNNTQSAMFDVTVYNDGAPPTILGQVVCHPATIQGSNQYVRFTTAYNERYASSGVDSATADVPVIRISTSGTIQYKHNDGSSSKAVLCKFTKKL
jgi:hypothetical protein